MGFEWLFTITEWLLPLRFFTKRSTDLSAKCTHILHGKQMNPLRECRFPQVYLTDPTHNVCCCDDSNHAGSYSLSRSSTLSCGCILFFVSQSWNFHLWEHHMLLSWGTFPTTLLPLLGLSTAPPKQKPCAMYWEKTGNTPPGVTQSHHLALAGLNMLCSPDRPQAPPPASQVPGVKECATLIF